MIATEGRTLLLCGRPVRDLDLSLSWSPNGTKILELTTTRDWTRPRAAAVRQVEFYGQITHHSEGALLSCRWYSPDRLERFQETAYRHCRSFEIAVRVAVSLHERLMRRYLTAVEAAWAAEAKARAGEV